MKILKEIMEARKRLIAEKGYDQGDEVPQKREVPLIPFSPDDLFICEIKRKSPSRANINLGINPLEQAGIYCNNGIKNISVLTEPDYFGGSLQDLMDVKRHYPGLSVLRKDFIIDSQDIDTAYRAGADAILLIAAVHTVEKLQTLYSHASESGMSVLFEIHDKEDLKKAQKIQPQFLGINTRDLRTFITDLTVPLKLKNHINWDCSLIFESGIHSAEQASFAAASGANGMLIGEAVVKRPELIPKLRAGFAKPLSGTFWKSLSNNNSRPLVKICGITNKQDLLLADELGADLAGFIFAESPRNVTPAQVAAFPKTKALKVGVIVLHEGSPVDPEILSLIKNGALDALQIHGQPEDESELLAIPHYYAISIQNEASVEAARTSFSPKTLIDAYSKGMHGGTGKEIQKDLLKLAKNKIPLWLAGGITHDNVAELILQFQPELIDTASGIEASPGKKDPAKMKQFFHTIRMTREKLHGLA